MDAVPRPHPLEEAIRVIGGILLATAPAPHLVPEVDGPRGVGERPGLTRIEQPSPIFETDRAEDVALLDARLQPMPGEGLPEQARSRLPPDQRRGVFRAAILPELAHDPAVG